MITLEKVARAMRALAMLPKPKRVTWVVNEEAHRDMMSATRTAANESGTFWPALRVYVKPGQIERVREFKSEAEAIEYLEER